MDAELWRYLAILSVAVVLYGTRIVGAEMMAFCPMTPRIEAVLKAMANAVLIAIVASELAHGGMRESVAVLSAVLAMLLFRNALVAMSAGALSAATYGWLLG